MEGEPDVQRTSERKLLPSPATRMQKGEAFKEGHRMKGPVAEGVVCVHIMEGEPDVQVSASCFQVLQ